MRTVVVVEFCDLAESIVLNQVAHGKEVTIPSSILETCQDLASLPGYFNDVICLLTGTAECLFDNDCRGQNVSMLPGARDDGLVSDIVQIHQQMLVTVKRGSIVVPNLPCFPFIMAFSAKSAWVSP